MHEPIDYVELPGGDMDATKDFSRAAFGGSFTDFHFCDPAGNVLGAWAE